MTYIGNLRHRLSWATASLDSSQTAPVNTQTLALRTLRRPLLKKGPVRREAKAENNYTRADKAGKGQRGKVNMLQDKCRSPDLPFPDPFVILLFLI